MGNPEMGDVSPEIKPIPESILSIFKEDVAQENFYSRFTDEQLSRLSENLSDYLKQASNEDEWNRMMEAFLDRFSDCFGDDHEACASRTKALLKLTIKHLTLGEKKL